MKKEYYFIILNTIIYGISLKLLSEGLIYYDSNIIKLIALTALLFYIFLDFGGEFIITLICSLKFNFCFNINVFVCSLILTHIIPKMLVFNIDYFFIVLFFINQILGFLIGIMLQKKRGDIF